jgi:hypothetical protein
MTFRPFSIFYFSFSILLAPALLAQTATAPTIQPASPATQSAAPVREDPFSRHRSSRDSRDSRESRSSTSSPHGPIDDDILLRKSIFAKDRRPAPSPSDFSPTSPGAANRKPSVPILIGVMLEDTGYVAYVEDPDSGKLWPFAVGDPLPADFGTVESVSLGYMDIDKPPGEPGNDASPKRILIGQTLAGETPASPALTPTYSTGTATGNSSTTTAPAGTLPALPGDPGALSLEERMKLRRQQQLGK